MSFIISVAHKVLFGSLNQGNEMGGGWGRHGENSEGILKEKNNLENLGVNGRLTLIFTLKEKKRDDAAWTETMPECR